MSEIVITTAKRLPIGKFMGSLSSFSAPQLGSSVIDSVISESGISKDLIDEIIMGQVLTGGSGQNPARQACMLSDMPETVSALTINQVCGSGLRSVMIACQSILSGQSEIVIAGGQESMSNAHHTINLRNGLKMGDGKIKDSMIIIWEQQQKILQRNLTYQKTNKINLQQTLKIRLKMLKKTITLKMKLLL